MDAYNNYVNRLQPESGSNYEASTKESSGAEQQLQTPVPIYFQAAGSNVVPLYPLGVSIPPSSGGYPCMNIDGAGTPEINQPLAVSVSVPPPSSGTDGRKHHQPQQYQVLYPINSQFATGGQPTDATIVPQQQIQYFIYSPQQSVDCDPV